MSEVIKLLEDVIVGAVILFATILFAYAVLEAVPVKKLPPKITELITPVHRKLFPVPPIITLPETPV
jgi:hypothetical protein